MIPTLLWHQTHGHIHFLINLKNVSNETIGITSTHFKFNGLSDEKNYEIEFELSNEVVKEESAYTVLDSGIKIILTKVEPNPWISLQKDKTLYKNNIKVNWDLWEDDDDDDEENMSWARMMQKRSMAGMGGMQGMGGMDMSSMMGGMDRSDFVGRDIGENFNPGECCNNEEGGCCNNEEGGCCNNEERGCCNNEEGGCCNNEEPVCCNTNCDEGEIQSVD